MVRSHRRAGIAERLQHETSRFKVRGSETVISLPFDVLERLSKLVLTAKVTSNTTCPCTSEYTTPHLVNTSESPCEHLRGHLVNTSEDGRPSIRVLAMSSHTRGPQWHAYIRVVRFSERLQRHIRLRRAVVACAARHHR